MLFFSCFVPLLRLTTTHVNLKKHAQIIRHINFILYLLTVGSLFYMLKVMSFMSFKLQQFFFYKIIDFSRVFMIVYLFITTQYKFLSLQSTVEIHFSYTRSHMQTKD